MKALFWVAAPVLIWMGLNAARPVLITPSCAKTPERCQVADLWAGDRIAALMESGDADLLSYYTQNTAGLAAFAVPLVFHAARMAVQTTPWGRVAGLVFADWVVMGQTMAWNGVGVELSHALWQRPRPFVYQNPAVRGQDPHHYTSFYSGHTSFVASVTLGLLLLLIAHSPPRWVLYGVAAMGLVLTLATAVFRVLAGRHFVTDTLVAAVAGAGIAYAIHRAQTVIRKPIKSKK